MISTHQDLLISESQFSFSCSFSYSKRLSNPVLHLQERNVTGFIPSAFFVVATSNLDSPYESSGGHQQGFQYI